MNLKFKRFHELSSEITFTEIFIIHQFQMEWDCCFHPFNDILIQSTFHFQNRLLTRLSNNDQFSDH